jgi:hypothetical protein
MARTVGIPNKFLAKLDNNQRAFLITAVGLRFYDEFLTKHGKHGYIFGTTGSGKTNKGYAFVDWLKYLEIQIWFDTGKIGEILPLLCMDRKVRIITPYGTNITIEERVNGKWERIKDHPEVIPVSSPDDAISSISTGSWDSSRNNVKDTITIISFRNGFSRKEYAIEWVAEFFERLAQRCRIGPMPSILPATIHIDESQWAIAGKRISGEGERTKASEAITENALELRAAMIRLILYAQGYKNIPPAARENMLFNVICRGGYVTTEENGNLSKWCRFAPQRDPPSPMQFKVYHGRFVFENGDSYPPQNPWSFRLYPIEERDRIWISRLRVKYEGYHDINTDKNEVEEECLPELGRFSALAIKPEVQEMAENRFNAPRGEIEEEKEDPEMRKRQEEFLKKWGAEV